MRINPEEIIQEAKQKYKIDKLKLIGLFSGGKDSLTACHYLWTKGLLNEVLYCKTGIGTKENFEYVKETCQKYNWKLNIVYPKEKESYEDFIRKFGFPRNGIHSAVMGFLKWHPIRKFAREHKNEHIAFVSGRRKKESKRRMKLMTEYIENPEKNMIFVAPLFYWTTNQVWNYIKQNKLEICPVYESLHMSGDCLCGSFSDLGESQLIQTFHPDLAKHIEQLELKHKGRWGNQVSMTGAKRQSKLVDYICNECIYST